MILVRITTAWPPMVIQIQFEKGYCSCLKKEQERQRKEAQSLRGNSLNIKRADSLWARPRWQQLICCFICQSTARSCRTGATQDKPLHWWNKIQCPKCPLWDITAESQVKLWNDHHRIWTDPRLNLLHDVAKSSARYSLHKLNLHLMSGKWFSVETLNWGPTF